MSTPFDTETMDEGNSNEYQPGSSLINAQLLREVHDLVVRGARIEKIDNNEQLKNSVDLLVQIKRTRKDLEVDQEKKVDPLYAVYKEAQQTFKTKIDALKDLERNISNKGAEWQESERKRIAKEEAIAKAKREEEARLIELEKNRKIAEMEALQKEAEAKFDAGQIDAGNVAADCANIAAQEAGALDEKIIEVIATPKPVEVFAPKGFKAVTEYSAIVRDHRLALKALVDAQDWGYLEGAALRTLVESAANKKAKADRERFALAGCERKETLTAGRGLR